MDKNKWDNCLIKYTGEYGLKRDGVAVNDSQGHLGITFGFFKELGIDDEHKSFLDIGCETSNTSVVKAEWTGLDIIEREDERIILGDAHELPFNDDSFDIIFSSHTLEHTISPMICLIEMKRVIKNDGDIIIGVPCDPGFMSDGHNYVLTLAGWKHLIEQSGFIVIKTLNYSNCGCLHCKIKQVKKK